MAKPLLDLRRIVQRQIIARQHQGRTHDGLAQLLEQQPRHDVLGNADADGLALLVLQASGCLAGRSQQESVGTRRAGFQ